MPLECALYYSNGIKGSNTKGGRKDSSLVIQLNHEVRIPIDEQRGITTGQRQHKPVIVIKELDAATPLLYRACCTGETLDELRIDWFDINAAGKEVVYFTTTLNDVRVVSVENILPNTKDKMEEDKKHLECLRLLYGHITWEHADGIMHDDAYELE